MTGRSPLDPDSAPLEGRDLAVLAGVELSLARGLALQRWWRQATGPWDAELDARRLEQIIASGVHRRCFRLTGPSQLWPENLGYGFLDRASIKGRGVPVIGRVQQVCFDRPLLGNLMEKVPGDAAGEEVAARLLRHRAIGRLRDCLREFALGHFFKLSGLRRSTSAGAKPGRQPLDHYLLPLSWWTKDRHARNIHLLNHQVFYKRRDTGRVGKFRASDRAPGDLRCVEPGGEFEWIVLHSRVLGESIELDLGYPGRSPFFGIPIETSRLGIVHSRLLERREDDRGETRGLYSLGFAVARDPEDFQSRRAGFSTIQFRAKDDGRILARMVYVRRRAGNLTSYLPSPLALGLDAADHLSGGMLSPLAPPLRALRLRIDPIMAYIELANAVSGGWAGRQLGITREQLERRMLAIGAVGFMHLMEHLLYIWRAVPDWTAADRLPDWVGT